ncbi:MAG: NYN domain-containing protein [Patescibacteria group bacterium]|jgi:uncharacterized LabA/DUF88 family protein
MAVQKNNYAFIDSNNLYLSISNNIERGGKIVHVGWKLDYRRFRVFLREKYQVEKAFLFIGFKAENENMYTYLQKCGYICVFKPTLELKGGQVKGNVDAELVLHSMIEFSNYDKAVIVSGDGDFYCLIKYLLGKNKFNVVLAPNQHTYSSLLDKLSTPANNILRFLNPLKDKLEYNK